MAGVLFANLGWVVLLTGWCIVYFVQAKSDKNGPARYTLSDAVDD